MRDVTAFLNHVNHVIMSKKRRLVPPSCLAIALAAAEALAQEEAITFVALRIYGCKIYIAAINLRASARD